MEYATVGPSFVKDVLARLLAPGEMEVIDVRMHVARKVARRKRPALKVA